MYKKLREVLHIKRHTKLARSLKFLSQIITDLGSKQIGVLSAGIAFYSILAFFPFVLAVVAFGSIFLDPDNIERATDIIAHTLPSDLANLLTTQLHNALGQNIDSILIAVIALIISLISISGVVGSLMGALNIIYERRETRSFIIQRVIGLMLAFGLVMAMLILLPLLLIGSKVLDTLGLPPTIQHLLGIARWIVLALIMIGGLNVIYRIGPSRKHKGRWPGLNRAIVISSLLWVAVSAIFFFYVTNMAHLTKSYSLFAGIIGMMLWFNMTTFIVLLGADIDHRDSR